MDVTYGLLSNLVKTKSIERILAPIASQVKQPGTLQLVSQCTGTVLLVHVVGSVQKNNNRKQAPTPATRLVKVKKMVWACKNSTNESR